MTATWFTAEPSTYMVSKIKSVVIDRHTESSVWIKGRRTARLGGYTRYFPTWDEAHTHLMKHAEMNVNDVRRQLERANGLLGNVKGMKPEAA